MWKHASVPYSSIGVEKMLPHQCINYLQDFTKETTEGYNFYFRNNAAFYLCFNAHSRNLRF